MMRDKHFVTSHGAKLQNVLMPQAYCKQAGATGSVMFIVMSAMPTCSLHQIVLK